MGQWIITPPSPSPLEVGLPEPRAVSPELNEPQRPPERVKREVVVVEVDIKGPPHVIQGRPPGRKATLAGARGGGMDLLAVKTARQPEVLPGRAVVEAMNPVFNEGRTVRASGVQGEASSHQPGGRAEGTRHDRLSSLKRRGVQHGVSFELPDERSKRRGDIAGMKNSTSNLLVNASPSQASHVLSSAAHITDQGGPEGVPCRAGTP